jgi:hypothetical protein
MHAQRRKRRLAVTVLVVIMTLFLAIELAGFLLLSRYVDTVEADAGTDGTPTCFQTFDAAAFA